MDFSRKNILNKLSDFFYGLAVLFAVTSSYAGVSSRGSDWIELFLFVMALAGVCALIGFILNLFREFDKNKFSSYLNFLKRRFFLQSENYIKDVSIRKYFVKFNDKIFCYVYALYFFIVLACLLNQNHFEWSRFIILDFIWPLVVWGVIKILTKKPEINKICIPQESNCILPTTQNPIHYTMKWDFEVWTKDKFMIIAPFYDIDKEKIVKACYFVTKYGERETVRFSDFIGELTPSQIFERKNELYVFLLSSKEYLLSTMNEHFESDSLYEAFDF